MGGCAGEIVRSGEVGSDGDRPERKKSGRDDAWERPLFSPSLLHVRVALVGVTTELAYSSAFEEPIDLGFNMDGQFSGLRRSL